MIKRRRWSLLACLPLLAACTAPPSRATREAHWQAVLAAALPAGTSRANATRILTAHGLVVLYRPYAELGQRPDQCAAHRLYAGHYGALHGLASRFDLRLVVCLDDDGRVARSYVDRLTTVI